jgi:leucyl-tRNA synthetase
MVAAGTDEKSLEAAAFADPNVTRHLEGKTVKKVILVRNRLVNIVTN